MEASLMLRELRRDYRDFPVLRGVTLELEAGQTLAVLGPNGAGKSTLLRILATLLRPTAGEVEVLGAKLPGQAWRARGRIGYLAHEPLLYRELTIRENLEFNARLHGLADAATRIAELLERAGLARRGDEYVRNLSAGMLQRAAICRCLLHEPELLLLDEPRSHLDVEGAHDVEEMLGPGPGRTRVVVTHDIEHGLDQADSVLALAADGAVAYAGDAAGISAVEARAVYAGGVR
ncbi:MAG TPA: ABC transporter ATP-binding protein [Solirubrobacterales bacterium]|nr:ABC transporter ATP-binding protein [Solirubrobacterales bacterium]